MDVVIANVNDISLSTARCDGKHVFAQATLLKLQQRWFKGSVKHECLLAKTEHVRRSGLSIKAVETSTNV
jgi:hypothetical protein